MAHAMDAAIQRELRELPGNDKCVDCLTPLPQCSGRHRSLGVHLSYVRSVSMDAWKDKEIAMMRVGGNRKLRDFFEAHGIIGTIQEKYNTPAAAMYRDIIIALRDGQSPPTDMRPYVEEVERDAASAAARMAALRGEVSSAKAARAEAAGAAGGSVPDWNGKGPSSSDDFFESFSTAKLSAIAGTAFESLATAAKTGAAKAAAAGSQLQRRVADAHLGERLTAATASAKATVTDPALAAKVQAGAASLWSASVSTAGSWWSSAQRLAADVMAEPGAAAVAPSAGGGGASAGTSGIGEAYVATAAAAAKQRGDDDDDDDKRRRRAAPGTVSRSPAAAAAAVGSASSAAPVAPSSSADDDAAWLASQVAMAQQQQVQDGGGVAGDRRKAAPAADAAAAGDGGGWGSSWSGGDDHAGAEPAGHSAAAPAAAAAAAPSTAAAAGKDSASAFDLSDMDAILNEGRTKPAPPASASAAPAAAAAKPAASDEDFFSSFGLEKK